MRLRVRSMHVPLTEAMRLHIERVVASLARGDKTSSVRVRLRDLNGPRGGVDQEALVVHHARGRTLAARAVDSDAYVALSTALERAFRQQHARGGRR